MNSPSEMTSKLKTSLSTAEVLEAQKKLKTIKYPVRALSNAVRIKKKLDHFDPVIRNKLVDWSLVRAVFQYFQIS